MSFRNNYNGAFETSVVRTTAIVPTDTISGGQEFFLPDKSYTGKILINYTKLRSLTLLAFYCFRFFANKSGEVERLATP